MDTHRTGFCVSLEEGGAGKKLKKLCVFCIPFIYKRQGDGLYIFFWLLNGVLVYNDILTRFGYNDRATTVLPYLKWLYCLYHRKSVTYFC